MRFTRRGPVDVEHTVPPADIVPTGAALLMDTQTRILHSVDVIDDALFRQYQQFPEDRNGELIDVLLDLRSTLCPSMPDAEVLRERPWARAVGRAAVPGSAAWSR